MDAHQTQLNTDEVHRYLKSAVDLAIGPGEYHHGLLPELHNNITEYAVKKISAVRPPTVKCIVTCTIVQNTGAGFHIGNALRWDESQDNLVTYSFQNKSMSIVVTAYLIHT
ncbi:hypothetical protein GGI25_006237 [Coemansia spiralis]|uniref:Uncharacterized protein n=2 Tax=Coemansia TaxID=4863 RepID=A0A9W8G0T2_9FUNG|nr:Tctex-1 [Coemansia spiralis]KAJ1986748.1 hypothetical protein EDC05_006172 [Coemansia umbellata]KAJ2618829.1 hypothetical protein GGI26_006314 [Coemansia sp. RSA 1358]KAJ2669180.1 hypothetical protein GGI25_006237 [Coemansia spiralis]